MSNKILNLVRDAKIGNPTAKEVLKVIADQANDAGTSVWSSIEYFVFSTERDRSTVKRALKFLQDEGFLKHVGWTKYGTHMWALDTWALGECVRVWQSPEEIDLEGVQTEPRGEGRLNQGEGQTEPLTPIEPKNKNSFDVDTQETEEPEYVNDVDGVPDERQMEWIAFIAGWLECFPMKAQPRKSNTALRTKFYARLKDAGFRANWRSALWNNKGKRYLQKDGWFKAKWFVHNDDNYEKLLDGTFDFKEEQSKAPAKQPKFVDARPKEDK